MGGVKKKGRPGTARCLAAEDSLQSSLTAGMHTLPDPSFLLEVWTA